MRVSVIPLNKEKLWNSQVPGALIVRGYHRQKPPKKAFKLGHKLVSNI